MPKLLLTSSALALVLFVSACSDQKSTTTHATAPETKTDKPVVLKFNTAPVANAGSDLIVSVGEVVTLNGTQSTDADHDLMTFQWKQASGEAVDLVNADTLTPSFIAPPSKQPLVFALVVSDGQDESETDNVSITISNRAPLANAGKTVTAKRGSKVTLDGSSSIDPDNDNLVYAWKQVYGAKVALNNAKSASPSFMMPGTSGYLIFALEVNDGSDVSIADTVAVKVTNTAPVARAGSFADNVVAGKTVQLDGSNSTDPDGDSLAFNWTQKLGTPVLLEGGNTATPRFVAPDRPDHLIFELTVNDGEISSHPDSLIVSVKNEVKQLESKPDLNKIAKLKEETKLIDKKPQKSVLAVADAPAPVDNFLPEIAKSFIAPAHAGTAMHGDSHGAGKDTSHAPEHKAEKMLHKMHWSYEGDTGPGHWGSLDDKFGVCETGQSQSPIDIQTSGMTQNAKPIEFHYSTSAIKVINNGHTIQANYDKGSYATIGGKRYDLLQFHFHSPSEHTVDGKPADLVAHLVHKAEDGELAVVGVLFKQGKENEFLKPIWSGLPLESGTKTESSNTIFVSNMLPEDKSYYHYTGSLTTPPCSEGVNWNVLSTTVEASATQIEAFTSIFSKSARPTLPLHGRMVSLQ